MQERVYTKEELNAVVEFIPADHDASINLGIEKLKTTAAWYELQLYLAAGGVLQ